MRHSTASRRSSSKRKSSVSNKGFRKSDEGGYGGGAARRFSTNEEFLSMEDFDDMQTDERYNMPQSKERQQPMTQAV
jgi:hypothetical protein